MNRVRLGIFGVLLVASGKLIAYDFGSYEWHTQQMHNNQMLHNQQMILHNQRQMESRQFLNSRENYTQPEPFSIKEFLGHGKPYKPGFNEED